MTSSRHALKPPLDGGTGRGLLISVVICTHNRCDLLAKTIDSLLGQDFPAKEYEIIVVDNVSTDGTGSYVSQIAASSEVSIHYVYESRIGVSHARNSGLEKAAGVYIAYIDDDEEASPLWLQGIFEAFVSLDPEPGVVCGPVKPSWERQPPAWLSDEFRAYLSILILRPQPAFLPVGGWGFPEGNSAFRTEVLRDIGGFATNVGRQGRMLLSGEEVIVSQKIRAKGLAIFYQPSMSVAHFIPADRLSLEWLTRRAYFQGITDAIHSLVDKDYGLPLRLRYSIIYLAQAVRPLLAAMFRGLVCIITGSSKRSMVGYVRKRLEFSRRLGWFYGFTVHSANRCDNR